MKLRGKTAVITGGGSGIGAAIAQAFAGEGCRVVIAGRQVEKLKEVAKQFTSEPKIEVHEADVGNRESVNALFKWVAKEVGPVHILVNAAGINIKTRMMNDMQPEQWDQVMSVNATGVYNCVNCVLPQMRERRDGLIINISSTSGKRAGKLGGVAYSASKFAVSAFSTAVSGEVAQEGVRVTSICPGEVDTPILANRPVAVSAEHRARMLQPEDVAAAALMVAALPPRANVFEMIIKPTTQEFA
jgi:NADP-dependent 3-hydroxy acid dehydrogenase YdfG